ncbi:MAG: serine/threonine protein kinase, partial [Pseudomonadota bacterium]
DNIYLRQDGEPMLIDFGSARQLRSDPATGRVALTPGYSAPEQYPGQGQVGPSSDLYSIGATLYRCITGRDPVDSYKRQYQFEKAKVDPLPPAGKFERPRYSAHIRETIDACLKLNP